MRKVLSAVFTAIAAVVLFSNAAIAAPTADFSAQVVYYVNIERENTGLSPLTWDEGMTPATTMRAEEASRFFSHTRPDGSPWYAADASRLYGENLAKGYDDAAAVVTAWMNSPKHRENILSSAFTTVNVQYVCGADGITYIAEEFG